MSLLYQCSGSLGAMTSNGWRVPTLTPISVLTPMDAARMPKMPPICQGYEPIELPHAIQLYRYFYAPINLSRYPLHCWSCQVMPPEAYPQDIRHTLYIFFFLATNEFSPNYTLQIARACVSHVSLAMRIFIFQKRLRPQVIWPKFVFACPHECGLHPVTRPLIYYSPQDICTLMHF